VRSLAPGASDVVRKICGGEQWPASDDCRPLDYVSQLKDIAGPSIQAKDFQALVVDSGDGFSVRLGRLLDKRFDQGGNIFESIAQRRQLDSERVEPGI